MEELKGYFMCPNCGNMIEDSKIQKCPNCTYDFAQLISCPYIDDDRFCLLKEKPCHIEGLDFEDCEIYIGRFHLGIMPE